MICIALCRAVVDVWVKEVLYSHNSTLKVRRHACEIVKETKRALRECRSEVKCDDEMANQRKIHRVSAMTLAVFRHHTVALYPHQSSEIDNMHEIYAVYVADMPCYVLCLSEKDTTAYLQNQSEARRSHMPEQG